MSKGGRPNAARPRSMRSCHVDTRHPNCSDFRWRLLSYAQVAASHVCAPDVVVKARADALLHVWPAARVWKRLRLPDGLRGRGREALALLDHLPSIPFTGSRPQLKVLNVCIAANKGREVQSRLSTAAALGGPHTRLAHQEWGVVRPYPQLLAAARAADGDAGLRHAVDGVGSVHHQLRGCDRGVGGSRWSRGVAKKSARGLSHEVHQLRRNRNQGQPSTR